MKYVSVEFVVSSSYAMKRHSVAYQVLELLV